MQRARLRQWQQSPGRSGRRGMEWVVGIQKAISASGALRLQLEKGESMEILLPMAMTDQQFTQEQWKRIDPGRSMWCWTTTRRRRGSGAD